MFLGSHRTSKLAAIHIAIIDAFSDLPLLCANIITLMSSGKTDPRIALAVISEIVVLLRAIVFQTIVQGWNRQGTAIPVRLADYMSGCSEFVWAVAISPKQTNVMSGTSGPVFPSLALQ